MQRRLENMATARGTAIVEQKDDVALLRHEFMPQEGGPAPQVADYLRVWTAVGADEYRILFLRIKIRRLDDAGIEQHAVTGLDGEKFYRREMVIRELHHIVLIDRRDA